MHFRRVPERAVGAGIIGNGESGEATVKNDLGVDAPRLEG